ncbi:MAG: division/cell wall cluster transcriptional repressor MraZ [Actinomycetota bacterium]
MGQFQHTVDVKGRVFIPARWREELGESVVVTEGLNRCLYVMPSDRFEAKLEDMEQQPLEHEATQTYLRVLAGSASEEQVDKQGRMNIPEHLRQYAGLGKEVFVVGVSRRVEIWDKDSWTRYREAAEVNYESIAQKVLR